MISAVFAQKIPEGRNLIAAVYDFANPENWGGVESTSYDIQNDTYVIKAYTMGKFLLGYQRQDQTVTRLMLRMLQVQIAIKTVK